MKPELEKLIDAVVRDGVVTEKERAVLLRKATELKVDPDEVEIYLEAKLEEVSSSSQTKAKLLGRSQAPTANCSGCGAANRGHFVCEFCGTPTGAAAESEADEYAMMREISKAARELAANSSSEKKSEKHGLAALLDSESEDEVIRRHDRSMAAFWKNVPLPRSPGPLMQAAREALVSVTVTGEVAGSSILKTDEVLYARAEAAISILESNSAAVRPADLDGLRKLYAQKAVAINRAKRNSRTFWVAIAAFFSIIIILPIYFNCSDSQEKDAWKAMSREDKCKTSTFPSLEDERLATCTQLCDQGQNWACTMKKKIEQ
jgi:hypothetical protein